jgi:hypothetical protein
MRHTHTYAVLKVDITTYMAVRTLLEAAGYEHVFHGGNSRGEGEVIDMHGIALGTRGQCDRCEEPAAVVVQDIAFDQQEKLIPIGVARAGCSQHPVEARTYRLVEGTL